MRHGKSITQEMRQCITNCSECHAVCVETLAHCFELEGEQRAPDHLRMLADCAQICATSADFMLRGSPRHVLTCGACGEICTACAEACEGLAQGDKVLTRCAEMCRQCAETCEEMAKAKV